MGLRVNDFETVRKAYLRREQRAALDRIEAEVERHRQHICWIDDELRAEVERLRALYNIGTFLASDDDNEETLLHKALAEVERLRAALERIHEGGLTWQQRAVLVADALAGEKV